jgi:hypothetical protein
MFVSVDLILTNRLGTDISDSLLISTDTEQKSKETCEKVKV